MIAVSLYDQRCALIGLVDRPAGFLSSLLAKVELVLHVCLPPVELTLDGIDGEIAHLVSTMLKNTSHLQVLDPKRKLQMAQDSFQTAAALCLQRLGCIPLPRDPQGLLVEHPGNRHLTCKMGNQTLQAPIRVNKHLIHPCRPRSLTLLPGRTTAQQVWQ